MPKIINAYSDANNSIADSLKSIGQSIWGDEAKNEGLRQNAEKLRRENAGRQGASEAFRRGDVNELGAQGILGGMSAGDTSGYGLYGQANRYGAKDPRTTNAWVGAGHNYSGSYPGFEESEANKRAIEQDKLEAGKYTPVYNEGLYGKQPAGAFNQKTGQFHGLPQPSTDIGFGTPSADPAAPTGTGQMMPPPNLVGDDLRAWLSRNQPRTLAHLEGILAGDMAPPRSMGAKEGVMLNLARGLEPGFDQNKWTQRNRTNQSFSGAGPDAVALRRGNQAIEHIYGLAEESGKLHNHYDIGSNVPVVGGLISQGTQALNHWKNQAAENRGDPGAGPFNINRHAAADELAGFFKGANLSDTEIKEWANLINSDMSDPQFRANIAKGLDLYNKGKSSYGAKWAAGTEGSNKPMPAIMNPRTEALIKAIEEWHRTGKLPPVDAPAQATALPPGPTGHPPSFNDRFEGAQPGAPATAAPQASAAAPQPAQGVDPKAIQYLQQHPETRAFFDQKYGAGASARILGQ